jgi:hypothetical protein
VGTFRLGVSPGVICVVNHDCAIVQPRLYDSAAVTQITLTRLVRSGQVTQVMFITRPKSRTMRARAKRKKRSRANRTKVPK